MDPAGNGPSTLGAIDRCVQVADGGTITFDVVVDRLGASDDYNSVLYYIVWAPQNADGPPIFEIREPILWDAWSQPPPGPTVLITQNPASGPGLDLSTAMPNSFSPHMVLLVDLATAGSESNPPYIQGVMGRFTARVGPGVAAGIYDLDFTSDESPPPIVGNSDGVDQCEPYGCNLLDGNNGYAQVAVDMPCPVSIGGIAELPDISDSSGPDYPYLIALAIAGALAFTVSAWLIRKRQHR